MTPTGEATEGVLTRLRKMEDLKPWGSIVYGPDSAKWGMSWNHVIAAGGNRRRTQELRREQMSARIEFLRIAMRRVCDFGQILVAGPARYRCSAPKTPRLTSAARLANLVALLARSVPTGPAARIFHSRYWKHRLCEMPFDIRPGLRCSLFRLGRIRKRRCAGAIRQRRRQHRQ